MLTMNKSYVKITDNFFRIIFSRGKESSRKDMDDVDNLVDANFPGMESTIF